MSQFVRPIEKCKINLGTRRHYHFNCEIKAKKMIVREDFTVVMDKIITIPYGEEERRRNIEHNQCLAERERIIEGMSADKLEEMLRELKLKRLFNAAMKDNVDDIKASLSDGIDPNVRDNDGATPLHYAARAGSLRAIGALLEAGADRNTRDNDGNTPRDIAEQQGHAEAAALLG